MLLNENKNTREKYIKNQIKNEKQKYVNCGPQYFGYVVWGGIQFLYLVEPTF